MGLFDSLFADAIKKEVDAQLTARLGVIESRLRTIEHRAAEAIAGNAGNAHNLGLLQGAISTLDRKVSSMREQMQSDEDYVRNLALRVTGIENTDGSIDGGTLPDVNGG